MKVLLFGNEGCGSCKKWKSTFLKLMNMYHLEFDIIDQYDPKNRDMIQKYNVTGIPDTVFIDDEGNEIGHVLGNMIEELAIKQIDYYVSLCR